jgi:hypothetical protein
MLGRIRSGSVGSRYVAFVQSSVTSTDT